MSFPLGLVFLCSKVKKIVNQHDKCQVVNGQVTGSQINKKIVIVDLVDHYNRSVIYYALKKKTANHLVFIFQLTLHI